MFQPNCVIALLSPEISLKSDQVRRFIGKILKKNVHDLLKSNGISSARLDFAGGRIFIYHSEPEKVLEALKKCFGMHKLFLAQDVLGHSTLEELSKKVAELSKGLLRDTFAVRGKSFHKDFSSKDLERAAGAEVLAHEPKLKVKLVSPKTEVTCIAFKEKAFIYFEGVEGAKGMPVGCQGKAGIVCSAPAKAKAPEDNYFRIAFSLLKVGCRVVFVSGESGCDCNAQCGCLSSKKLKELEEYNSGNPIKLISVDEAKQLYKDDRIRAFFCTAKTIKEAEKASDLVGVKCFAPLLF